MCNKKTHGLPRIQELCSQAAFFLGEAGVEVSRLEAELLLGSVLKKNRAKLLMDALEFVGEADQERFQVLLKKRAEGMPLQYLLKHKEFMGREFTVTPDVLIPRDDTAVLVETVIEKLSEIRKPQILDLCTGSGIVAVTLSLELGVSVYASDISEQALRVARENSRRLGAEVSFRQGNLLEALKENDGPFDVIASNPPYISEAEMETLQKEVKREPVLALCGGSDGLDYYRSIIRKARPYLKKGGLLLMEIGYTQELAVKNLLLDAGYVKTFVRYDMAGHPRVVGGVNED